MLTFSAHGQDFVLELELDAELATQGIIIDYHTEVSDDFE
jgi:hypothetical protein